MGGVSSSHLSLSLSICDRLLYPFGCRRTNYPPAGRTRSLELLELRFAGANLASSFSRLLSEVRFLSTSSLNGLDGPSPPAYESPDATISVPHPHRLWRPWARRSAPAAARRRRSAGQPAPRCGCTRSSARADFSGPPLTAPRQPHRGPRAPCAAARGLRGFRRRERLKRHYEDRGSVR